MTTSATAALPTRRYHGFDISPLLGQNNDRPNCNQQSAGEYIRKLTGGVGIERLDLLPLPPEKIEEIAALCTYITKNPPFVIISRSPMHAEWDATLKRANGVLDKIAALTKPVAVRQP